MISGHVHPPSLELLFEHLRHPIEWFPNRSVAKVIVQSEGLSR